MTDPRICVIVANFRAFAQSFAGGAANLESMASGSVAANGNDFDSPRHDAMPVLDQARFTQCF
jgi:hypothetical protein